MSNEKKSKLWDLIARYKTFILITILFALFCISSSLLIYYLIPETHSKHPFWMKLADLFMVMGETVFVAGVIGGGIGTSINFVLEEMRIEEEKRKEDRKDAQENREKRKIFRIEMRSKLQKAHDNIELARILIKSHKSGRTYGEQIRNRIMPVLISLIEFKRELGHAEERHLRKDLKVLQVSLRYMIAYLNVLVVEFEERYLKISNIQNYQDALVNKMRILYLEAVEGTIDAKESLAVKNKLLEEADVLFENFEVPPNVEVVWKSMESLDYVWDFIEELRFDDGRKSLYNRYFLKHYIHCKNILKVKNHTIDENLIKSPVFKNNLKELDRIEALKKNGDPLTKDDSLTRIIMGNELEFDFETSSRKQKG